MASVVCRVCFVLVWRLQGSRVDRDSMVQMEQDGTIGVDAEGTPRASLLKFVSFMEETTLLTRGQKNEQQSRRRRRRKQGKGGKAGKTRQLNGGKGGGKQAPKQGGGHRAFEQGQNIAQKSQQTAQAPVQSARPSQTPFVRGQGTVGPVTVTIVNKITAAGSCSGGKVTLTIFIGSEQILVTPGADYTTVSKDWGTAPGLGVQVNGWWWARGKDGQARTDYIGPKQGDKHQNPDNSGAQLMVSEDCKLRDRTRAWFGDGVETYVIANIDVGMVGGKCTMTVSDNEYTGATTPGCCSPFPDLGQCAPGSAPKTEKAGFNAWVL